MFLGRTKGLPGLQPWGLEGRIPSELGRGFGETLFLSPASAGSGASPGLGGHFLREPWGGSSESLGPRRLQHASVHPVFRFAECHQVAQRAKPEENESFRPTALSSPASSQPSVDLPLMLNRLKSQLPTAAPSPANYDGAGGPLGSPSYQSLAVLPPGLSQQLPNPQDGGRGPPSCLAWSPEGALRVSAPETGVGSLAGHWLCDLEPSPLWVSISHLGNGNSGLESPSCMQLQEWRTS